MIAFSLIIYYIIENIRMCIEIEEFRILKIKWKIKCSKTKCICCSVVYSWHKAKNINIS